MNWETALFIIGIIVACNIGWLVDNWIRAKHGYPLEDEWGGKIEKIDSSDPRETEKLREQNQQLRDVMERMEDRMVVLERIVTDKGYTVAEEIEALRDKPSRQDRDSGVPLDMTKKERI
ncbi:hypothetical protein [Aurantiacibacter poecillastricola]|uniref:hypothetical protein n=1 Tax=Aurantiacibacter poecillastricola TaxID=3064385 RepID=UPI00273EB4F9|nr:hypothetical protein [Aurantiacibacter sp. 219JJ12-13]MDP5262980.1 hypothetical protein [Aurantiacibacter sp. 219JJ12-13]